MGAERKVTKQLCRAHIHSPTHKNAASYTIDETMKLVADRLAGGVCLMLSSRETEIGRQTDKWKLVADRIPGGVRLLLSSRHTEIGRHADKLKLVADRLRGIGCLLRGNSQNCRICTEQNVSFTSNYKVDHFGKSTVPAEKRYKKIL